MPRDMNGVMNGKFRFINYVVLPTGKTIILDVSSWTHNIILHTGRINELNLLAGVSGTNPIKGMGIGTGTTALNETNSGLGAEVQRVSTVCSVSPSTFSINITATLPASVVNTSTEIGLFDNATMGSGIILTRSVYTAGNVTFPDGTEAGIQYVLQENTTVLQIGWTATSGEANTYQATQMTSVLAVVESDTGNGYAKVSSILQVQATANTYYYNSAANLIYIHCSDGANPSTHSIMVISGVT